MRKIITISILCMALTGLANAQNISGPQSGTFGPGIYNVIGDISVPFGETLTILPGTTFLHAGAYAWNIYGQFNADGTETDSIYFIRQNPTAANRWRSLRFQSGASDASAINYCVIDNCDIPSGTPSTMKGGGIFTDGVDITVTNSRISNCDNYWAGGGIYALGASIIVENCLIVDNTATLGANGGGIYLYNSGGSAIMYNEIARNSATGT